MLSYGSIHKPGDTRALRPQRSLFVSLLKLQGILIEVIMGFPGLRSGGIPHGKFRNLGKPPA